MLQLKCIRFPKHDAAEKLGRTTPWRPECTSSNQLRELEKSSFKATCMVAASHGQANLHNELHNKHRLCSAVHLGLVLWKLRSPDSRSPRSLNCCRRFHHEVKSWHFGAVLA